MDYSSFEIRVEELLSERRKIHENDPALYKFWNRLADFMATDQEMTISFLDQCDAETVSWMSEVFEDISQRLKSKQFIYCLERLVQKFPNQNLKSFVDGARSFL